MDLSSTLMMSKKRGGLSSTYRRYKIKDKERRLGVGGREVTRETQSLV